MEFDVVAHNVKSIEQQVRKVFENHKQLLYDKGTKPKDQMKNPIIVNNADWYEQYNFVEFVSQIGRHFRMGNMLSRASVQSRLKSEQGMSFTEFTYQLFQAYDWLHLLKHFNCRFQLGGSDQMGNIVSGHELIGRVAKTEVFGLTLPLITNEEGDKFGKSAGNAVWLDAAKTSEFAFYQFFVRLSDAEAENLVKLLTFLPINEVNDLIEKHRRTPELREAQKTLAKHLTLLIHGEAGLEKALMISDALYKGEIQALGNLKPQEIPQLFAGASYTELIMEPGTTMMKAALRMKCFPSEFDANRIITAGGFYINQKRTTNPAEILSPEIHILPNGVSLFRVGKKNYHIVRWV
jgi:tyrosyl-tRNA synthetase